jgi:hypothetical protein
MLEGQYPTSHEDWTLVMNFMAANVHDSVAESACQLMAKIYHMPLTKSEVTHIVDFQLAHRR